MFYTYVIYSKDHDRLYIGQTTDISVRLKQHNEGRVKSTKHYIPWQLIHYETFESRSDSMKRETELKSHKGREFIRIKYQLVRVRHLPD